MGEDRFHNKVLYMDLETTNLKGRPRNRRQDEVKGDGKQTAGKRWKKRLYNREERKKLMESMNKYSIMSSS
jgi:hypothetical protein